MILLRRLIGDALRRHRQDQDRTLREVSSAARVSLGYLSEVERGQKEASSELLTAICDALGVPLSALLREVSDALSLAEQLPAVGFTAGYPPSSKVLDRLRYATAGVVPAGPRSSAERGPAHSQPRRPHRGPGQPVHQPPVPAAGLSGLSISRPTFPAVVAAA